MKRIAYAEEWLNTDDRLADLVLEYAQALARKGSADTVAIPVVEDGAVRHAEFLIGPASQIIVIETDEEAPAALDVREAVAELQERLTRLTAPGSVLYDGGDEPHGSLPEY